MYVIAALYHFTRFADPAALKPALEGLSQQHGVTGTLLLAGEGVNGTIAGGRAGIDAVLAHLRALPGCADLEWKEATSDQPPFGKMKVRLKKEIVTMGQPDVDPRARVGHYVDPADWNDLIRSPDVAVIDTRNDYEVAIGTFDGAVDPETRSFGEFPAWWEANKDRFHNKRIAMFCTGGIRCEKSTNFLLGQGVEDVYHLKGGILKYLEDVPPKTAPGKVSVSCSTTGSASAMGWSKDHTACVMAVAVRSFRQTGRGLNSRMGYLATNVSTKPRTQTKRGFANVRNRSGWRANAGTNT